MPLLLFGSGVIFRLTPANAQQQLPDPRIFDELPPPSPSPIPSINSPTPPLPSSLPSLPADRRNYDSLPSLPSNRGEYNFPPSNQPMLPSTPTPASTLYRVDIYGDNPSLLSQVKQIEPGAFVRRGEGVIQAGVFVDEANAQFRIRELEAQGIPARLTTIGSGVDADLGNPGRFSGDNPDNFDRVSREDLAFRRSGERAYFVVIPGKLRDLPEIAAEVVRMGIREDEVTQREAPRGPHVAIGPFNERERADRWSRYFRSVGMDARVYFGN
ncbi:MAG TPA: hypothetical protein DCE56_42655 [Cyanobacteria bacterium UBA8553]|nr:hypothetical protein [Cyanobacteria bacterium UBA8553]